MKSFFKKIVIVIIQYEAKLVLRKYTPKIVVVVGSVGKTTTKDAVYEVLKKNYFVRKSQKSFNSEIGVPLTILGLKNAWSNPFLWIKNILEGAVLIVLRNTYPTWIVLEVGADHPGDIRAFTQWIDSDIAIITRLPDVPVHVEHFLSPEQVVAEKVSIIDSLKEGGTLILNVDDEKIRLVREKYFDQNIITYGMNVGHDVSASHYGIIMKDKKPVGTRFHVLAKDQDMSIELLGVLGKSHVYPVLAATAVVLALGDDISCIGDAFLHYRGPNGRMCMIEGIKNTILIDDTYNSSPVALLSALDVMGQIGHEQRKIAVLGDMLELGKYSIEAHKEIGKKVHATCDILLTIGIRARGFAEGAIQNGMRGKNIFQYDDRVRAGKELEHMLLDGDIVLLKASQGGRLEKIVEEIMAQPMQKNTLLVRQDKEWQVK